MIVGVVCDGSAESQALEVVVKKINGYGTKFLKPLYADMQPKATEAQIAKKAEKAIGILRAKKADLIIVLLDFEDREGCPGEFSEMLANAFIKLGMNDVSVVIKMRTFENWLVADPEGIGALNNYKPTKAFVGAVAPNKADHVDGEKLINSIIVGRREYHKRIDAINIAKRLDVSRASKNSRSFRRFLRLVNHEEYADQSKLPLLKKS